MEFMYQFCISRKYPYLKIILKYQTVNLGVITDISHAKANMSFIAKDNQRVPGLLLDVF